MATRSAEVPCSISLVLTARFKLSDFATELLQARPDLGVGAKSKRFSLPGHAAPTPRGDAKAKTILKTAIADWKQKIGCDRVTLWLLEQKEGCLYNIASSEMDNALISLPLGVGLAGTSAQSGEDLFVPDAYKDGAFNPEVDKASGFKTKQVCCVALKHNGKVAAVVQLLNKPKALHGSGAVFTPEDAAAVSSRPSFSHRLSPSLTSALASHVWQVRSLKESVDSAFEVYWETPAKEWKNAMRRASVAPVALPPQH